MFDTRTAQFAGLAGIKNGALLAAIEGRFDVFVTIDGSLGHQQNLSTMGFGVVVLTVSSNRVQDILATVTRLIPAIEAIVPAQILVVS